MFISLFVHSNRQSIAFLQMFILNLFLYLPLYSQWVTLPPISLVGKSQTNMPSNINFLWRPSFRLSNSSILSVLFFSPSWTELNFNFLKIISRWLRMSSYVWYFQELNKKASICLHGNFSATCHIHFKCSLLTLKLWCSRHLYGGQQHTLYKHVRNCHQDLAPGREGSEVCVCGNFVLWCPLSF